MHVYIYIICRVYRCCSPRLLSMLRPRTVLDDAETEKGWRKKCQRTNSSADTQPCLAEPLDWLPSCCNCARAGSWKQRHDSGCGHDFYRVAMDKSQLFIYIYIYVYIHTHIFKYWLYIYITSIHCYCSKCVAPTNCCCCCCCCCCWSSSFLWRVAFLLGTLLEHSFSLISIPNNSISFHILIFHSKYLRFIDTFLNVILKNYLKTW